MPRKTEVIYDDNQDWTLISALDKTLKGGVVEDDARAIYRAPLIHEAATVSLKNKGSEVLWVSIDYRKPLPPTGWRPVARVDERTIGTHTFIVGRQFFGSLSARTLAQLEAAFGRHEPQNYLAKKLEESEYATPVDVDTARVHRKSGQGDIIYVRWLGLWFPCYTIRRFPGYAPTQQELEAKRREGQNYPNLSIV